MGVTGSLILIAVGAILRWAVTADAEGIDLATVGIILLVIGGVGLFLSLMYWSSWGGFGPWRRDRLVRRGDVYERPTDGYGAGPPP